MGREFNEWRGEAGPVIDGTKIPGDVDMNKCGEENKERARRLRQISCRGSK